MIYTIINTQGQYLSQESFDHQEDEYFIWYEYKELAFDDADPVELRYQVDNLILRTDAENLSKILKLKERFGENAIAIVPHPCFRNVIKEIGEFWVLSSVNEISKEVYPTTLFMSEREDEEEK